MEPGTFILLSEELIVSVRDLEDLKEQNRDLQQCQHQHNSWSRDGNHWNLNQGWCENDLTLCGSRCRNPIHLHCW